MKNNKKGITLIALIITIIIMLILVAVTILMAVNGGLFGYAGNATKETQKAIDEEKMLSSGIIDDKSIADYIYGDAGHIKFVDYKNTRFLMTEVQDNKVKLIPLTIPTENQYLLSGKYKVVNGKKVSVELSDPSATADASFAEFQARIKDELDDACQERYGTSDGKITATNSTNYFTTIIEYYNSLYDCFDNNEINSIDDLANADIALFHELNEGLDEPVPKGLETSNTSAQSIYMAFGAAPAALRIKDIINNQYNNYLLGTERLTFSNDLLEPVKKLLRQEITVDDLDESDVMRKYSILLSYEIARFEGYIKDFIHCTGSDTHNDSGYWRSEILDWWDGYTMSNAFRIEKSGEEDEFNAYTTRIAPILLVDQSLLQRVGPNTYILNVN